METVEEFVKCMYCHNFPEDAKLLPCSHSFCSACITEYLQNNDNIACPTCGLNLKPYTASTQQTTGNDFPNNDAFNRLSHVLKNNNPADLKCKSHADDVIKRFCNSCLTFVCETCLMNNEHSRCFLVDTSNLKDVYEPQTKLFFNGMNRKRDRLTKLHAGLLPKKRKLALQREETSVGIAKYFSDLRFKFEEYLIEQEKVIQEKLDELVGKELQILQNDVDLCSAVLDNFEEKFCILKGFSRKYEDEDSALKLLYAQEFLGLNLKMFDDITERLQTTNHEIPNVRFIINTDFEDSLTTTVLVNVEIVQSRIPNTSVSQSQNPNSSTAIFSNNETQLGHTRENCQNGNITQTMHRNEDIDNTSPGISNGNRENITRPQVTNSRLSTGDRASVTQPEEPAGRLSTGDRASVTQPVEPAGRLSTGDRANVTQPEEPAGRLSTGDRTSVTQPEEPSGRLSIGDRVSIRRSEGSTSTENNVFHSTEGDRPETPPPPYPGLSVSLPQTESLSNPGISLVNRNPFYADGNSSRPQASAPPLPTTQISEESYSLSVPFPEDRISSRSPVDFAADLEHSIHSSVDQLPDQSVNLYGVKHISARIHSESSPNIVGMVFADRNVLLALDRKNKNVKIYDLRSGRLSNLIRLGNHEPWDIAKIYPNTSAVVIPGAKAITFIIHDGPEVKKAKSYATQKPYTCLTFNTATDEMVCACNSQFGSPCIDIVDENFRAMKTFDVGPYNRPLVGYPRAIVADGNWILVSDFSLKCVRSVNTLTNEIREYRGTSFRRITEPCGLAMLTSKELVFASNSKKKEIHVLDKFGRSIRLLDDIFDTAHPGSLAVYDAGSGQLPMLAVAFRNGTIQTFEIEAAGSTGYTLLENSV